MFGEKTFDLLDHNFLLEKRLQHAICPNKCKPLTFILLFLRLQLFGILSLKIYSAIKIDS